MWPRISTSTWWPRRDFVRYVYDDTGAPEGSEEIHDLLRAHFATKDLPLEDLDLAGRSDHGPFLRNGVPVGGLFTGADMIKTASEVESYGGIEGDYEDQCYHRGATTPATSAPRSSMRWPMPSPRYSWN